MTKIQDATLLWVCTDCYLTHHGYDEHELGTTPDREPLSLIPDDAEVTAGMLAEEHECAKREDYEAHRDEECECEQLTFTWSACDGCGSTLGGSRDALTMWTNR